MPKLLASIVLLAIGSGLLAAPVPKELKKSADAERMQGVWFIETIEGETRWLFRDGKFYSFQITEPDNLGQEYRFALLPDGGIDLVLDSRTTHLGHYRLDGGELVIARSSDGLRPKNFDPDPLKNLLRFKRVPEVKK